MACDACCCCLVAKSYPTLATPWTVTCQAPLSMEFSRQEHWSGLPFPAPGDLPNSGIKLTLTEIACASIYTKVLPVVIVAGDFRSDLRFLITFQYFPNFLEGAYINFIMGGWGKKLFLKPVEACLHGTFVCCPNLGSKNALKKGFCPT